MRRKWGGVTKLHLTVSQLLPLDSTSDLIPPKELMLSELSSVSCLLPFMIPCSQRQARRLSDMIGRALVLAGPKCWGLLSMMLLPYLAFGAACCFSLGRLLEFVLLCLGREADDACDFLLA